MTKLLDAGERLPVHSHPDRAFAAAHLDCDHGKTEAWIVLDAEPGAVRLVGFRDELAAEHLAELVDAQDERLLDPSTASRCLPGDAVLVPGGQPHAIGEGVFVLELQEPTDLSVMLEHRRFGLVEAHAFLGLTVPRALESVDPGPLTAAGGPPLRVAGSTSRARPRAAGAGGGVLPGRGAERDAAAPPPASGLRRRRRGRRAGPPDDGSDVAPHHRRGTWRRAAPATWSRCRAPRGRRHRHPLHAARLSDGGLDRPVLSRSCGG